MRSKTSGGCEHRDVAGCTRRGQHGRNHLEFSRYMRRRANLRAASPEDEGRPLLYREFELDGEQLSKLLRRTHPSRLDLADSLSGAACLLAKGVLGKP